MTTPQMLIDGRLVSGVGWLDVINPATGGPVARAPRADPGQLDEAVAAAQRAFPAWAALGFAERRATLGVVADALEAQMDAFARLLTLEQGKPLAEAFGEVGASVAALRVLSQMDLPTELVRETAAERVLRQHAPLGVVAAITPWNFPLLLLMAKLAPALLAGNTVVAKPAPTTPLTALRFGELCAPLLPTGVLNVIADANDLGDALSRHPGVAKISFTGSTATGRKVMGAGADSLKRLTLELGGNDAAIVLADADIEAVAPALYGAAMAASGQVCLAIKRVYVHASLYDRLCARLADLARQAVVGDGMDPGVQIGPVQNRLQFEKLKGYLQEAHERGVVLAGGAALERPGYFIPPTIVRDLPDTASLVQEEQFGPILPVLPFEATSDAVARANGTPYGLGASVWTADPASGLDVAAQLDAGAVWVNRHLDTPFDLSFCAAKQSGFGFAFGPQGLAEFTQSKIIIQSL